MEALDVPWPQSLARTRPTHALASAALTMTPVNPEILKSHILKAEDTC